MMKEEFEAMMGHSVGSETYKKIEICYMCFDFLFPTKIDIAEYYRKHDIEDFERLYLEALQISDLRKKYKKLGKKNMCLSARNECLENEIDAFESTIMHLNKLLMA